MDIFRLQNCEFGERMTALNGRVAQCRIFYVLNIIAAVYGVGATYLSRIDEVLRAAEFSAFERGEIRRRLDSGYAYEALTPGSPRVGTPPLELLGRHLRARHVHICELALTSVLSWLARQRAISEAKSPCLSG